ncbi:hypothetical protein [Bradyrhizobium sp. RDM4]|uniref:hypothetical protein n=1 Tax=Bradyrhizobium sp. RDM4 TaxID=3378765 RepID=UPI0038FC05BD
MDQARFKRTPTKGRHTTMAEELSISVFTIEVDRNPVVAFAARKYSEAEAIVPTKEYGPNSVRRDRAASLFATNCQHCAFDWQIETKRTATENRPPRDLRMLVSRYTWSNLIESRFDSLPGDERFLDRCSSACCRNRSGQQCDRVAAGPIHPGLVA